MKKARKYGLFEVSIHLVSPIWQGQKDLNPRHAVLETAALPTELYPYRLSFTTIILYQLKALMSIGLDIFLFFNYTLLALKLIIAA